MALFVHRNFFAFEDYLYRALRLIFVFAGFNCFGFHIRWIQRAVDLLRFFVFEDYLNRALLLALVSLDSTVLIFMFAGFNTWFIFFDLFVVVMLQDVEVLNGFSYPSEFLCF